MVTTPSAELARARARAAQPGHGEAVRERGRRVQRPHDRHPRRDRPRAADQARRLDRDTPGATPRSSSEHLENVVMPPGRRRRRARLPPVHDPRRRPRPRRVRRRARESTASAAASTTRSPIHRLPVASALDARPARDRARAPRGPVAAGAPVAHRRTISRRIVEAVNAVAKAGSLMALRAGVLGLGVMGRNHARVLAGLDGRRVRRRLRPGRRTCPTRRRPAGRPRPRRVPRARPRLRRRRRADRLPPRHGHAARERGHPRPDREAGRLDRRGRARRCATCSPRRA